MIDVYGTDSSDGGSDEENLAGNSDKGYLSGELVSVITPCYNSSRFISQTIESVLDQTYQNWEMIIAYDLSNDNSIEIINKYLKKDARIKLIELGEKSGPAIARNRAIEAANGRYIAFLDSDDIWLPTKLEKQIRFMRENDVHLCYSSYYLIDEYGNELGIFVTKDTANYRELLKTCYIGNLTAIYDAGKIDKQYMANVEHQDYTLWLKILKNYGAAKGIIEPLAKYRIHRNSISANKIKAACWQWNIYRNVEKLSFSRSAFFFIHYAYYGIIKHRQHRRRNLLSRLTPFR